MKSRQVRRAEELASLRAMVARLREEVQQARADVGEETDRANAAEKKCAFLQGKIDRLLADLDTLTAQRQGPDEATP